MDFTSVRANFGKGQRLVHATTSIVMYILDEAGRVRVGRSDQGAIIDRNGCEPRNAVRQGLVELGRGDTLESAAEAARPHKVGKCIPHCGRGEEGGRCRDLSVDSCL